MREKYSLFHQQLVILTILYKPDSFTIYTHHHQSGEVPFRLDGSNGKLSIVGQRKGREMEGEKETEAGESERDLSPFAAVCSHCDGLEIQHREGGREEGRGQYENCLNVFPNAKLRK